jgi:adenylate cyclase
VAAVFAVLAWGFGFFQSWQWQLSDRLHLSENGSPNVVVATIDDASLDAYGRIEQWPRTLHARAIENLRSAGASVIVLDLLLAEESPEDAALAATLADGDNVVLAVAGTQGLPYRGEPLFTYQTFMEPAETLQVEGTTLGHANFDVDGDGVVRRVPLAVAAPDGREYPALSLVALYKHFRQPLPSEFDDFEGRVQVLEGGLEREVPLEEGATMRVRFAGWEDSFATLSYADAIEGRFDASQVQNKIVLVGMTAIGGGDLQRSPAASAPIPGVFLHANAVDTLLRARFLEQVSPWISLVVMLGMVGAASLALPRLSLGLGTGLIVVGIVAYLVAGFLLFDRGLIINYLHPPLALIIVYVVSLAYRTLAERADRREMGALFGRYVSPQVADELVTRADAGELSLGGELREATILFADLRGFTTVSEQVPPEQVVDYLNRSFAVIISQVMEHGGMVNKFGGDAIMAVWNTPHHQEGHALEACSAALASVRELEGMPDILTGAPQARFGFGINTGNVVAGSVGSAGRAEYTVIGDPVNVASRLCSGAPGGEVWLGPETYEAVKEQVTVEALGPQSVKGKAEPIEAYRLIEVADGQPPAS